MVFSYTTNGASGQSSVVRGNVALVSGTWTAGGASNGTIDTGQDGTIIAAGVTCDEAVEAVQCVWNSDDGTADTSDGSLYIVPTDTTNNTGNWWAIVVLG